MLVSRRATPILSRGAQSGQRAAGDERAQCGAKVEQGIGSDRGLERRRQIRAVVERAQQREVAIGEAFDGDAFAFAADEEAVDPSVERNSRVAFEFGLVDLPDAQHGMARHDEPA